MMYAPVTCYTCGRLVKSRLLRIYQLGIEAQWNASEALEHCLPTEPSDVDLKRICCRRMVVSACPTIDDWRFLQPKDALPTYYTRPEPRFVRIHVQSTHPHYVTHNDSTYLLNTNDLPDIALRKLFETPPPLIRFGSHMEETAVLGRLRDIALETDVYATIGLMCACDYAMLLLQHAKLQENADESLPVIECVMEERCLLQDKYELWAKHVASCERHVTHCEICGDACDATRCAACTRHFRKVELPRSFTSNPRHMQRRLMALRAMRHCTNKRQRLW